MMDTILLFGLGTGEIIAIIVVILLLFGGRKIPELMRGLGKGVKEFKNAQNADDEASEKQPTDKDHKVS